MTTASLRLPLLALLCALASACSDDAATSTSEGSGTSGDSDGGDETTADSSSSSGDNVDTTSAGDDDDDDDGSTSEGDSDSGGFEPALPGPFNYSELDDDGVAMIDALFVLTQDAVAEIQAGGQTLHEFLDWRIADLNGALERSLIDSSRVRSLGYHVLVEDDYERAGVWPGTTDILIGNALGWLSSYRRAYGADKILIIGSTAESASGVALGGGDVSSYWVEFLPINHEFGHCMGGAHCYDGNPDVYHFGFPLAGYDEDGLPNDQGLEGGTMMCGNSVNFFSNPDVSLGLEEIEEYVALGMMPDQDYAAVLGPDDTLQLGHPVWANMAQTWRDNELKAARAQPTSSYPGHEDLFYEKDDCAGFYADEGYADLRVELCAGESSQALEPESISSVLLGRDVHANLYSDAELGAGSTCGGLLQRLGFSSPSLAALSEHRGDPSIDDVVAAALVYVPDDRPSHRRFEGDFDFYSSSDPPYCSSVDGETLTVLRDGVVWTGTAAVYSETLDPPYAIEFEYRSLHVGEDPPADALVVFFAKDASAYEGAVPPRETLGFLPDGSGYGVELNVWTNSVSVRDGDFEVIDAALPFNSYTDGEWVPVRVEVGTDSIALNYGGQQLLSVSVPVDASHGGIGFSAASGAYSAEFSVRNLALVPG